MRTTIDYKQARIVKNTPIMESIKSALSAGRPMRLATQYRIIPLRAADDVRMVRSGELQIRTGRTWVYLTMWQVLELAAQTERVAI